MAGSTPKFNHGYIYLLGIFYGFFTRDEHYGPGHFIWEIRQMALSGSLVFILLFVSFLDDRLFWLAILV
jgi:hypothetical protein